MQPGKCSIAKISILWCSEGESGSKPWKVSPKPEVSLRTRAVQAV